MEDKATYPTSDVREDILVTLDTPELLSPLAVPHDDITAASDIPTQLLPPQSIADEAVAGPSPQGSLDTGGNPSLLHDPV